MQLFSLALYGAALLTAVKAAPSPMHLEFSVNKDSPVNAFREACLMLCFPEQPQCGGNSYAKQFGQCWTCCTKIGDDSIIMKKPTVGKTAHAVHKEDVSITIDVKEDIQNADNICLKVCWPETPRCPNGWYSNNFGKEGFPCWTCCKAPYDDEAESTILMEALRQQEM